MNLTQMDLLVDQLRCSCCKKYLRCPPIVLLANGTSVCGRCTPLAPIVKELALESVLRELSFPCKYKSNGCKSRAHFGREDHDEKNCIFRNVACPLQTCSWLGSVFAMQNHIAGAHPILVKADLVFKLQLEDNCEGLIFSVVSGVSYLLKYTYNAEQGELKFKINSLNILTASYKTWMFNEVKDCGVSLKNEKCCSYIFDGSNWITLNLHKYLPVLEEPECLVIDIKIMSQESPGFGIGGAANGL